MATSGWDLPPPIASPVGGEWKSRRVRWRTPQRIATLTTGESTTCHPILVLQRYLLVAGNGFVSLFSLDQIKLGFDSSSTVTVSSKSEHAAYWKYQTPNVRLALDRDSTIVQLLDCTKSNDDDEEMFGVTDPDGKNPDESSEKFHSIFALSEEGDVYHLQLVLPSSKQSESKKNDGVSTQNTAVTLICANSWNTGTFGPTCIHALRWGDDYPTHLSMVIGYESGHLEGWRISEAVPLSTPKSTASGNSTTYSSPNKRSVRETIDKSKSDSGDGSGLHFTLQWRGYLHQQAPIRSVTALGRQTEVAKDAFEADPRIDVKTSLVLTMEIPENSSEMQGTASMVDVLQADFKLLRTKFVSNNRRSLRFLPNLQMPTCGMEFVDSSTAGGTTILSGMDISSGGIRDNAVGGIASTIPMEYFPKRLSMLPSRGTDSSISLSCGKQCGVFLSDGTLAILSSDTELGQSSSSWGITKDVHQLLLSYPAIGCGRIHHQYPNDNCTNENERGSRLECIACCLRGGTCFLIPVVDKDVEQDIVAIPHLHDVDSDWTAVCLQGFAAGDLRTTTDTMASSTTPILVYAKAGGALDVYACTLMNLPTRDIEKAVDEEEKRECVSDLLKGQTLSIVSQIMEQMDADEGDPLWQDSLWKDTHEAFQSAVVSPASMDIELLLESPAFASFKKLLRSLAS